MGAAGQPTVSASIQGGTRDSTGSLCRYQGLVCTTAPCQSCVFLFLAGSLTAAFGSDPDPSGLVVQLSASKSTFTRYRCLTHAPTHAPCCSGSGQRQFYIAGCIPACEPVSIRSHCSANGQSEVAANAMLDAAGKCPSPHMYADHPCNASWPPPLVAGFPSSCMKLSKRLAN